MMEMKRRSKVKTILHSLKRKDQNIQVESSTSSLFFTKDMKQNEETLKGIFGSSTDIVFRPLHIQFDNGTSLEALLVLVDGITDEDAVRNNVINPLIEKPLSLAKGEEEIQKVKDQMSIFNNITNETNVDQAVLEVFKGTTLLLVDGFSDGLLLKVAGYEVRSIEEPETEKAVRGAHDGFIESITTNVALLRRRIPHPSFKVRSIKIGEYSQTDVIIAYVEDIADPKLINRIKKKLNQIKVDNTFSSGEIEQSIEDHPYSIFPTIGNTERPDKAARILMDGKVVIIIDGDPVALYAPYFFLENIHSVEDYASRPYYTSFLRLLRFFSFLISILIPGLYIAVLNFHKVMIPSDLIIPLTQARETVPFPLVMEVLIIIAMFEAVREASVRLPQQVGSSLSIVGALIFGQVAVQAGIVGAPTTIFISIAYISSFINNSLSGVSFLLRIWFLLAGSLFGAYGIIIAFLSLITHMVSLTSIGVPYMAPVAPFYLRDWTNLLIRAPYRWLKKRPHSIPHKRTTRIKSLPKAGDK